MTGGEHIRHSVQVLDTVAQENARSSQELAAVCEDIVAKLVELTEVISFFKTDGRKTNLLT